MEREREQDEKKGKDRRNYIDRANSGVDLFRKGKSLKNLLKPSGKRIASMATRRGIVAGAAATWEIWVPILIVLFLIIFFTILTMMIFGGTAKGLETEPSASPETGGPPGGGGTTGPTPTPLAIDASSCPILNGVPSCGSKNVPRSACGHCNASYIAAFGSCNYYSLQFAIDIPGPEGSPIILPAIGGERIRWTWLDQPKNVNNTAIQRYSGLNEETGEQYLIKFHHSTPGSGGGTKYTGGTGATICTSPCDSGTGPHVHTEFAKVNSDGSNEWVDAPLYFCN